MQKIIVKDFGPINNVEIEIGKITLLIGEQATGKSTISQLIYFFKSLKEDFFTLLYNRTGHVGSEKKLQDDFFAVIRKKFYNFFGSTKHIGNFSIKYFYSNSKTITLSLFNNKSLKCDFDNTFFRSVIFESEKLVNAINQTSNHKNAYDLIAEEQSKSKFISRLASLVNNHFEDEKTSLYIPAGRIATTNYAEYFDKDVNDDVTLEKENSKNSDEKIQNVGLILISDFLKKVSNINKRFRDKDFSTLIQEEYQIFKSINKNEKERLELFNNHINEILKGDYKNDKYGEKLYLNKTEYVYLKNASSGQQESIRILQDLFLILLNKEKVFRVIEEPEAHLFPLAQKKLIELIALVANNTDSEFIVTTHSPYVLSVFNNLLFASRITKENFYFRPYEFRAYTLLNNKNITHNLTSYESILNQETGLISENFLDDISIELSDEYEEMLEVYKKVKLK